MAIQFHEAWRPAAFDQSLMERMSNSYAGNTFLIIRAGLRREVLLSLMRLWDNDKRALDLRQVADDLECSDLIDALAVTRASKIALLGVEKGMRADLQKNTDACLKLIRKYLKGGSRAETLVRLRKLRNQVLAHRQMKLTTVLPDTDRDEVEELYTDMLELVGRLFSLTKGISYNLTETADIFRHYAGYFWEPVCGERFESHPRFRPVPASQAS